MAPGGTENNAYAKFGVTNKEHYVMLWCFNSGVVNGYFFTSKVTGMA